MNSELRERGGEMKCDKNGNTSRCLLYYFFFKNEINKLCTTELVAFEYLSKKKKLKNSPLSYLRIFLNLGCMRDVKL